MDVGTRFDEDKGLLATVAADVLDAWQNSHGTTNGEAYTMVGPQGLVVFIEDAFSRAELKLAEQREGSHLLNRYVRGLLQHVCREQVSRLERVTGRDIVGSGVSADLQAGWVMCFFRFGRSPS